MAGNPPLLYEQQQAVSVAIEAHLDQSLLVARCLALAPKLAPRAREVGDLTRRQRKLDRLSGHPRLHQYNLRLKADSNGGDQASIVEPQGRPQVRRKIRRRAESVRWRLGSVGRHRRGLAQGLPCLPARHARAVAIGRSECRADTACPILL